MKLFIFSFIAFIFISIKSYSENMIPLKNYLKNNKNLKDTNRTIYILKRCVSLHYFLTNNEFKKKDNNIVIRYGKDYSFFSVKLYSILNLKNYDIKKFNNEINNEILKLSNKYTKDAQINLLKTGSNFQKSYIIEDLKVCSKIQ
tara:strand:+ start:2788 stop:3219 length:432 start_codon:yes stop_codon:yes gene_type:complete